MVEAIARKRGHDIVCIIDAGEECKFSSPEFQEAEVAVDFSVPGAEPANVEACFRAGVPVVCGTTGWQAELPGIKLKCETGEGTLLWSSNFSIGVNVFMAVNRFLAHIMDSEPQYRPSIEEVHHVHKLDHPSGTAVTLAQELARETDRVGEWTEDVSASEADRSRLLVTHRREGEVPGIHTVTWDSPVDTISISHSAKSREGFALGAVKAAEWLKGRGTGFYTMRDVLDF